MGEWIGEVIDERAMMRGCEKTKGVTVELTQPPWETALKVLLNMLEEESIRCAGGGARWMEH